MRRVARPGAGRSTPGRGLALVELLVAIVIIAILATVFYGLWGRGKGGKAKSTPGEAINEAKGVDCQSRLSQLRMSLSMDMMDSGQPPATIPADASSISTCPVSGKPYAYDPRTGQVACPTPGHERY